MGKLTESILVDVKNLHRDMADIVEDEVMALHNDLIDVGQAVWLSGEFKNSFAPVQKFGDFSWLIENDAEHASILARGRRYVGGRWYGSVKWAEGLDPMIEKLNKNIEDKANAIRV